MVKKINCDFNVVIYTRFHLYIKRVSEEDYIHSLTNIIIYSTLILYYISVLKSELSCVAMEETAVIIVGAGPAGLATAACLKKLSIPHIVLEKEECLASLWRNRSYDRLHLHLAKEFCALPYAPHSAASPTYIPKDAFIRYLDDYALRFGISPRYRRCVEAARFDDAEGKWRVVARHEGSGEVEEFKAAFLVVASGDNAEACVPVIPGKEVFGGEIVHSREYKSGKKYEGKEVLVVGCGNSGMEIAYDVSNYGGHASIVVRSPV